MEVFDFIVDGSPIELLYNVFNQKWDFKSLNPE